MKQEIDFNKILKEAGVKVTAQRTGILELLRDHPGNHLTVEEIYLLLKTEHPNIGLATVYRTMQLLSELHLIDRINLDDGCVRYEYRVPEEDNKRHHHHHLICIECGNIMSFEEDLLDELEERILKNTGFKVNDHEVKLYGYCKECGGKLIE